MSTLDPARPLSSRRVFLTAGATAIVGGAAAGSTVALADHDGTSPALAAILARLEAARVQATRAGDALEAALARWRATGGDPVRPEALVLRLDDAALGLVGLASRLPDGRHDYQAEAVGRMREMPRTRVREHRRPAALADGFSAEEVASGTCIIVSGRRELWPEAQARAEEIITAWTGWLAEGDRRRAAFNLPALFDADAAGGSAVCAILEEIRDHRPRTMADLAAKARVGLAELYGDDLAEALAKEMAEADTWPAEIAFAVLRDAAALGLAS